MHTASRTRFEHEGWDVRLQLSWDSFAARYTGGAELYLRGSLRCRIALGDGFSTEDEGSASLRDRAMAFIADWQRRDHPGDSDFSEL